MSKLYGEIVSDSRKSGVTSRGHKHISAHIRGWSVGVEVEAKIEDGKVVLRGWETGGSGDSSRRRPLFEIPKGDRK